MDKERDKDVFYFNETFFDTYEEFMEAAVKYSKESVSDESLDREFKKLRKTIIANIQVYDLKISNKEMISYMEDVFIFFFNKMMKHLPIHIAFDQAVEKIKNESE